MESVKLGLIGLGYIGKVHFQNCLRLKSAKLVAVSDVSKKALCLAKKRGVTKTYADYISLLDDKDIDAVIIALPTHLHATCVEEATKAGKHIFLEKPLARNSQEGRRILYAVSRERVKLMIGYHLRFSRNFQELGDRVREGELGEIQTAYATNVGPGPFLHRTEEYIPKPVPEWWFQKELSGGGALIDLGSHIINLLRWYFGEISSIRAHLGYRYDLEIEDSATCMLRFKEGQNAVLQVGWVSQKSQIKVELIGTVDHSRATQDPPSKVKTAIQLMLKRTPDYYVPHLHEIQYFVNCLRKNLQPSPSGEDGLADLEAIEKAYKNQMEID